MNPLLENFHTPNEAIPFDKIKPAHFEPAIRLAIKYGHQVALSVATDVSIPSFENTILVIEEMWVGLDQLTTILSQLNQLASTDELRNVAEKVMPEVATFRLYVWQSPGIFKRLKKLWDERYSLGLNDEEVSLLDIYYQKAIQSGVGLDEEKKLRLKIIEEEITRLTLVYRKNVLAAEAGYYLELEEEESDRLSGLPQHVIDRAAAKAQDMGKRGWVFTLQRPSFEPVITYAQNRELRREIFMAQNSVGCKEDYSNNLLVARSISKLRFEKARLLGFESYGHLTCSNKMSGSPATVNAFLESSLRKHYSGAAKEMQELRKLAKEQDGIEDFQSWDVPYYARQISEQKFTFKEEVMSQYFELGSVINAIFGFFCDRFGYNFVETNEVPLYHSSVKTYEVWKNPGKSTGKFLGLLYLDLHPRKGKRSGAWEVCLRTQHKIGSKPKMPHVLIAANITAPTSKNLALLMFSELITLFHEFGHALQSFESDVVYPSLAGTNVKWDFVEFASKFMEKALTSEEVLTEAFRHYKSQTKLPKNLYKTFIDSKKVLFHSHCVARIRVAQLDMAWHSPYVDKVEDVIEFEKINTQQARLLPTQDSVCKSGSFTHVFGGKYAGGYYGYLWAEELVDEAFNKYWWRTCADEMYKSLTRVLSRGGASDPERLYKENFGVMPELIQKSDISKLKIFQLTHTGGYKDFIAAESLVAALMIIAKIHQLSLERLDKEVEVKEVPPSKWDSMGLILETTITKNYTEQQMTFAQWMSWHGKPELFCSSES